MTCDTSLKHVIYFHYCRRSFLQERQCRLALAGLQQGSDYPVGQQSHRKYIVSKESSDVVRKETEDIINYCLDKSKYLIPLGFMEQIRLTFHLQTTQNVVLSLFEVIASMDQE